jgi:hypothetical protein
VVFSGQELLLVRESRLAALLPTGHSHRWEASGVLALDGRLYVVCDDLRAIARLGENLLPTDDVVTLPDGRGRGYEDLAHDPATGRFYLLVESLRNGSHWMARVEEYDADLQPVSHGWLDFDLPSSNKGMEGLTCVRRSGTTYLLGLCEGNFCADGSRGRTPGGGRIQVFEQRGTEWSQVASVRLPSTLPFRDYSALGARNEQLAVVSQESSALWVGRLEPGEWAVRDAGTLYGFPRDQHGKVVYCNVEGVSWLSDHDLVMVSDRAKRDGQPDRCRVKEASIHVFALPDVGPGPSP